MRLRFYWALFFVAAAAGFQSKLGMKCPAVVWGTAVFLCGTCFGAFILAVLILKAEKWQRSKRTKFELPDILKSFRCPR
jgi:hypothetical protein